MDAIDMGNKIINSKIVSVEIKIEILSKMPHLVILLLDTFCGKHKNYSSFST
jgi:hypothetical protein